MKLHAKQVEALNVINGEATYAMLFGGSRCVAGDTIIDGQTKTIKELAQENKPIEVITSWGKQWAESPFWKGSCPMMTITLASGKEVTVTPDHRFWDGLKWIKAKDLNIGSFLASQSSEKTLPPTSSESFLLKSLANVQRWTEKLLSLVGNCFRYSHRCDQQPRYFLIYDQVYRALRFDAMVRNLKNLFQTSLVLQSLGLNNHIRYLSSHDAKYNQNDPSLCHPSKLDDSPSSYHISEYSSLSFWQTFLQSLGLHLNNQQSLSQSYLYKSFLKALNACLYRFCRFLGLSYDIPHVDGYMLEAVINITETTEKDYYTLHVPIAEQYYANGILHHNSGKTFLLVRQIIVRALKAPRSRHAILRFRFNQVKNSIVYDTFPKVMELSFPGVKYNINKTDWFITLPNGSEIWFGGLDDKERTEKILGMEFVTIYLNECSQIPYNSVGIAITRLAQKVEQMIEGKNPTLLKPRMYYDCNPPNKNHWTYSLFVQKRDPETKNALNNEHDYVHFQINPFDNKENLSDGYLDTLKNLSARLRKRFLEGEFADANPNQLFKEEDIDKWRVEDERLPDFVRVLVGVDPSGSGDTDNADNDAIGIVVGALGVDGNAYLLEDCTIKAGPATWGKVAASAFDRHKADLIVAESNFGGEMVKQVIQTARPRTPYKAVSASRGKVIRAEPFSLLYEQGKIRHCGRFIDLEDEMAGFSTQGYIGNLSPNRVDAWIWVLSELFPGMLRNQEKKQLTIPKKPPMLTRNGNFGGNWM